MTRFWILAAATVAILLILFLAAESLRIPLLTDPVSFMRANPAAAASFGLSLLIVDAVLPVPSSLVMIVHGALFGIVGGAIISLLGSLCAAMLGFAIGRAGGRIITAKDREQAERLLQRWGALAVVVTRPVPLLAETVAIMAGASGMRLSTLVWTAALGSFPAALLYAWAGAAGGAGVGAWPFTAALLFAAILLIAGRRSRSYPHVVRKNQTAGPPKTNSVNIKR